jgi:Holliday junction resolvase RusA-like endonuclease
LSASVPASKHKRDLDNQNKIILESMTGIVWRDDCQIGDFHLRRHYDTDRRRIELAIAALS